MCLLVLAYQRVRGVPVFVAANREESPARPSVPPDVVREPDGVSWFGGRDAVAGGTWLGVNEFGLVVGITNRNDRPAPANAVSRGLLCRELLKGGALDDAVAELDRRMRAPVYAGFNLLLASRDAALVWEHGRRPCRHELTGGLFVLTNSGLDDEDSRRGEQARRQVEDGLAAGASLSSLVGVAEDVCRSTQQQPQTGRGSWGTVSAAVIALPENPADAQFHFADGPPRTTSFESYSDGLRIVLRSGVSS